MKTVVWIALIAVLIASGCAAKSPAPGVPAGAALLLPDYSPPLGQRDGAPAVFAAETEGALYVFDATTNQVIYSGNVAAGQPVKIYPGAVTLTGRPTGRRTVEERTAARLDAGRVYRVYFHASAQAVNPTPDPRGALATMPVEERQRVVDPTARQGR
jgi:hypothetical protein